jgi:hypothetical protein
MQDRTETLALGSRAPELLLSAANRYGLLSLSGFLFSRSQTGAVKRLMAARRANRR